MRGKPWPTDIGFTVCPSFDEETTWVPRSVAPSVDEAVELLVRERYGDPTSLDESWPKIAYLRPGNRDDLVRRRLVDEDDARCECPGDGYEVCTCWWKCEATHQQAVEVWEFGP